MAPRGCGFLIPACYLKLGWGHYHYPERRTPHNDVGATSMHRRAEFNQCRLANLGQVCRGVRPEFGQLRANLAELGRIRPISANPCMKLNWGGVDRIWPYARQNWPGMGCTWTPPGVASESVRGRLRAAFALLRSFWHRFGVATGSVSGRCGVDTVSRWGRCRVACR